MRPRQSCIVQALNALTPVSPFIAPPYSFICPLSEEDDEGWESIEDAPVEADAGEDIPKVPGDIVDDDDGLVVQRVECIPCPPVPSPAEVARHNLTHLPYRAWCKFCLAARRQNSQHRSKNPSSQRTCPLLCADYAQVRDCQDRELATLLVGRLYPAKSIFATVCDQKGADEFVIQRLAVFIRDSGYRKIVYKSDQEASIKLAFEQAFRLSCREGAYHNPHLEQFVPENSAVDSYQSKSASVPSAVKSSPWTTTVISRVL